MGLQLFLGMKINSDLGNEDNKILNTNPVSSNKIKFTWMKEWFQKNEPSNNSN